MAITKNSGRQELIQAYVDINFGDLTSGADAPAIDLPRNAVIVGGSVVVVTPFNSATSDVLDVGDASSENRYVNDVNIHTAGLTALVPTGFVTTTSEPSVTVRWTGVGAAPTAGQVRLSVQYYVKGRAAFSQG
jgi:hypothetical protein